MSNQQESQADIPDGYVAIRSDDGQHYLVPHFMIPATHQAMEAYRKKIEFNVHEAYGGVSFPSFESDNAAGRCRGSGRCRVLADAMCWPMPCLLAHAVYPLTHHQFAVWKHDR
jgi:hypothetical protein